jgi:hypothetical protein
VKSRQYAGGGRYARHSSDVDCQVRLSVPPLHGAPPKFTCNFLGGTVWARMWADTWYPTGTDTPRMRWISKTIMLGDCLSDNYIEAFQSTVVADADEIATELHAFIAKRRAVLGTSIDEKAETP